MPEKPIGSVEELEERLSRPTPRLVEAMAGIEGDIVILGVGGKVGPSLARMAVRAAEAAGVGRKIIGVDLFPESGQGGGSLVRERLDRVGVVTVKADLTLPGAFEKLPDARNVIYMIGRKFGSTGAEWETWMTNVFLAGQAAQRYSASRIVAFSSGNVYPFVPVSGEGATESTPPAPVGEYAVTCLGRERMFEYHSHRAGTPVVQFRLNYAAELRYGVVLDIAQKVLSGSSIDVAMGYVNVVWQGYVCAVALGALALAASPPRILNVAGPELVSIRSLANRLGRLLGREPKLVGEEAETALLSNAADCHRLFGYPEVGIETLAEWVAHWLRSGGPTWDKPTHYEARDGKF